MNVKFSFGSLLSSVSKLVSDEEVLEKKLTAQQKSHQQEIENSILVLAAAVIRCDKNFSADTENLIAGFLSKQFGDTNKRKRLHSIATHIETGTEPFTKIACKELKLLTTHDSRISILRFLFGVAAADDFVNAKETRCIHRIATYLGISEKDFKELKQHFLNRNSPYAILGVEENATLQEIKAAHRKMVLRYHPDKRGSDVSEEEAAIKFREVQRAYDKIREELKTER